MEVLEKIPREKLIEELASRMGKKPRGIQAMLTRIESGGAKVPKGWHPHLAEILGELVATKDAPEESEAPADPDTLVGHPDRIGLIPADEAPPPMSDMSGDPVPVSSIKTPSDMPEIESEGARRKRELRKRGPWID